MFRRRKPVKQLSADELKSKLFEHFHKTGTLNKMRTELRGKLVTELFKISEPLESSNLDNPTANFDKTLLPLQVCNWLVYDHLLRQGYQYALSTFVTEANLPHPEGLLTACDILSLFGLDSSTPEYKNISQMYSGKNEKGVLHSLLLAVIKSLFDFSMRDDSVKRDPNEKDSIGISFGETTGNIQLPNKTKVSEYPHILEYTDSTAYRLDKSTDSDFHEQLHYVKEEKDREMQALRQKLVQELEHLHSQENKMRVEIENERREMKRKLDALDIEKEKFKEREILLIKEHENKLEKKIRELEVDFVSKMHSKEKELDVSQGKLYDKEVRLAQVEADFASLQGSYNSLRKELEEIRHTYSSLLDENTNLVRKFESMSDYSSLKGDLEMSRKEMIGLKKEMENVRKQAEKEKESLFEKVRGLETKLRIKEPQLIEAQRQLNIVKDTQHMEEATWHRERKRLEQESQASKEIYNTLIQRLEEQKDDIQALHHTIHILHYQLTDTDKGSKSKTEKFIPYRTAIKIPETSRREPEIFRINNNVKDSLTKYKDSLKFIEEAKDRISKLQQETNTWQDKSSKVYCSLPGFQDSTNSENISTVNATSYLNKTFKMPPYSNRFENLIRNEMPTLDLNMPTHVKSQLVGTPSSIYSPMSSSLTTHATSVKYSSDNIHQKQNRLNTEFSGNYVALPTGLEALKAQGKNIPEKSAVNVSFEKSIVNNKHAQKKIEGNLPVNLQQSIDKIATCTGASSETVHNERSMAFQKEAIRYPHYKTQSISEGKTEDAGISQSANKEGNEFMLKNLNRIEENLPVNLQQSIDKIATSTGASSETVHNERSMAFQKEPIRYPHYKTQSISEGKTEDVGISQSANKEGNEFMLKNLNVSQEGSKSDSSTRMQVDPQMKVRCADGQTTQLDSDKDNLISQSKSESGIDENTNIVIDLDAEWKRKASLKDDPKSQPVSPVLVDLDSAWKRKTSLMSLTNSLFQGSLLTRSDQNENLNKDEKTDADKISFHKVSDSEREKNEQYSESRTKLPPVSSNNSKSIKIGNEIAKPILSPKKNIERSEDNQSFSKNQSIFESPVEAKTFKNKTPAAEHSEEISNNAKNYKDPMESKDVTMDNKQIPEDSLSELSEVHLSCGSEQEQQKGDSDNW